VKSSYPIKGTTLVPASNRDLSEKVSAAILSFPVKHVADAANRTPEAAKKWRSGLACPDLASAINMARDIKAIKWLLIQEMDGGTPDGIFSQRTVIEAMGLLQRIADGVGEDAEAARKILSGAPQ
jgi:hypothetical protein